MTFTHIIPGRDIPAVPPAFKKKRLFFFLLFRCLTRSHVMTYLRRLAGCPVSLSVIRLRSVPYCPAPSWHGSQPVTASFCRILRNRVSISAFKKSGHKYHDNHGILAHPVRFNFLCSNYKLFFWVCKEVFWFFLKISTRYYYHCQNMHRQIPWTA